MAKTRELSESIRNANIKKHNNSMGYKAIAKDLVSSFMMLTRRLTVMNLLRLFQDEMLRRNSNERSLRRLIRCVR